MNKKELKKQIKDLNDILLELVEHSPSDIEFAIKFAKIVPDIKTKLENRENIRKIKQRKLTDLYMRKFNKFDIEEALNLDIKEAENKVKHFNFTAKEKNKVMETFCGDAKYFLDRYERKVIE